VCVCVYLYVYVCTGVGVVSRVEVYEVLRSGLYTIKHIFRCVCERMTVFINFNQEHTCSGYTLRRCSSRGTLELAIIRPFFGAAAVKTLIT
jgi:hypothetical protein